jgi:uncharacterized membrane protein YvbJ
MVCPNCNAENREGCKFCAKCGRHNEWPVTQGRTPEAAALLEEAREIFDRLTARPWLERVAAAGQGQARVPA